MRETIIKTVKDPITLQDVKVTAIYEDGILVSQTNEYNMTLFALPLCPKCDNYHKSTEYCKTNPPR